jgi:hypothetical protein
MKRTFDRAPRIGDNFENQTAMANKPFAEAIKKGFSGELLRS